MRVPVSRRLLISAAAVAALCVPCLPVAPSAPVYADEVDDVVASFRELVKQGDDTAVVRAVQGFEKRRDRRVDEALLPVARGTKLRGAAKEAMRVLGLHRDATYLSWVRSRLYDKKIERDEMELYTAMLDSLPAAGDALKPFMKDLAACFRENLKSRPEVTTRVAAAFGRIRDTAAITTLFALLEESEQTSGGSGGGRGGLTTPPPLSGVGGGGTDISGNLDQAREAAGAALKELTGATAGNSLAWRVWWLENEKTFRFKRQEPDWETLAQYSDENFGFTLKKPGAGKGWTFERSAYSEGLAGLRLREGSTVAASLDALTMAMDPYTDAAAYAQYVEERWRTAEFASFAEDGVPAISTKRIGGREFAVVRARGAGSDAWKDWTEFERRLYVTVAEPGTFLIFDAAIRSGTDESVAGAFWANLDAMTFRKVR